MLRHKPITVRGIKLKTFPLDTSPQETQLTDFLSDYINAKVIKVFETQDEIIQKFRKKESFCLVWTTTVTTEKLLWCILGRIIFHEKKCWSIPLKKRANVRLWRTINISIEFLFKYLYFQAFLTTMIPMPWTKSSCFQTEKTQKKKKLVDWQVEGTKWIKRVEEKRTWRSYRLEIECKKNNLWQFRNKGF